MAANDKQVGGTHYQGSHQHWDMAVELRLHHLAAAASKYLTRYHKKNGVQDLEKSKHYIEKWIELLGTPMNPGVLNYWADDRDDLRRPTMTVTEYLDANDVPVLAWEPLATVLEVDRRGVPLLTKLTRLHRALVLIDIIIADFNTSACAG